jgi:hypothetical protein
VNTATLLPLLLLAAATPAGAADREWHRYRAICEKLSLDEFTALPELARDRLQIRIKLAPSDGPRVPVTLTIVAAKGRLVIPPGLDGLTDFPVRQDLLAENPMVLTSLPEGIKTSVSLELTPRLPPGLSFAYADLMRSVEQANRVIKSKAGFFSFAAPRMRGVLLQFPEGAPPATAHLGGAAEAKITSDGTGALRLPLDETLLSLNPQVVLSSHPATASFFE